MRAAAVVVVSMLFLAALPVGAGSSPASFQIASAGSSLLDRLQANVAEGPQGRVRLAFLDGVAETPEQQGAPHREFLSTLRAGDLNDDGMDDVLLERMDSVSGATVAFEALSGKNGAVLWSIIPSSSTAIQPLHDGTLLRLTLVVEGAEQGACFTLCAYAGAATLKWALARIAGTDGSVLWEHVVKGSITTSRTQGLAIAREEAGFLTIVPCQAALCVGTIDIHQTGAGLLLSEAEPALSAHISTNDAQFRLRMSILSMETGEELQTLAERNGPVLEFASNAGDINHDGMDEILMTGFRFTSQTLHCFYLASIGTCGTWQGVTSRLELLDGATFGMIWTREFAESSQYHLAFAYPVTMDMDADGNDDFLLYEIMPGPILSKSRSGPVSGATGASLWSVENMDLFRLGEVGGSPGADVAYFRYLPEGGFAFGRFDGATGEALGFERRFENMWPTTYGNHIDQDSDGVREILVSVFIPCECGEKTRVLMVSGRSGNEFVDVTLDGKWQAGSLGYEGDISLVRQDEPALGAITGGELAWSVPLRRDGFVFALAFGLSDLDGDGRHDVVAEVTYEDEEGLFDNVVAMRGSDGTVFWTRGEALGAS